MNRKRISAKIYVPVWKAFRRRCHRFLAIGYRDAMYKILNESEEETDITGFICEALERWFIDNPKESEGFFVCDDPPVSGSGRSGKRRPRTDIKIGYAAGRRPEFFFEAKRLCRPNASASRYTGVEGIHCFLNGRYACQNGEAAMLGYVQSDSLDYWNDTLYANINSNRKKLNVKKIEQEVRFSDSFPLEWASTHGRDGLIPIRLFHILLDCRKNKPELDAS